MPESCSARLLPPIVQSRSGYAHGFLTLSENATVLYLLEGEYKPEAAATVRWNDPLLGIYWPNVSPILSDRDRLAGDFLA